MNKSILSLALLPALALVGCNPNTTDGMGSVTLAFDSTQTSARALTRSTIANIPVIDSNSAAAGSITLDEAWVVIKEIELEHENDDENATDDELEIEFVGPFAVDLLSGTTYPALPSVSIDTGLYNDIEMDIEKLAQGDLTGMPDLPQGIADQLLNYSLYLSGTYTSEDGTTYSSIPFSLSYDQTDEFEFTGTEFTNGFVVDDTGINDIIVAFRMNDWFDFSVPETNSDFLELVDAISQDSEGADQLILDGNTNSDIMDVIEDNIEDSAEYGEDDDDDGELDEDEDDDND